MATKVETVRQSAADAQTELRRVLVEETDERPALILAVDPVATKVYIIRQTTRDVSAVDESVVEIHDDELATIVTILTALKKTV